MAPGEAEAPRGEAWTLGVVDNTAETTGELEADRTAVGLCAVSEVHVTTTPWMKAAGAMALHVVPVRNEVVWGGSKGTWR